MIKTRSMVTARDVAALAGVSQSTVSRVLNPNGASTFISAKTAERVREAVRQLNYSPHPIARALRGENTHLIGLLVREISDPFFAEFIALLSSQVRAHGYNVVLGHVHSDPSEALNITQTFDDRQLDGVICMGDFRDDMPFLMTILKSKRPAVALCHGQMRVPIPAVNCNNASGVKMLLDHLIALGHYRFAFLDGGWLGDIRLRREAFMEYFTTRNIKASIATLQADANSYQGGYDAMMSLLGLAPRPTAVLASDDQMAMGALRAATQSGFKIPGDLSITGFDDCELASFTSPNLTTIRQPKDEMGRQAIDLLFAQMRGEAIPSESMYIEVMPELVVRESTGPVVPTNY
jgi:DNA-binding LacI/PurR family transcriptional regulator